jgi:hypothetical protein
LLKAEPEQTIMHTRRAGIVLGLLAFGAAALTASCGGSSDDGGGSGKGGSAGSGGASGTAGTGGGSGGTGGNGMCGGFAGLTCEGTDWCDYDDGGLCGNADGSGVCRPRPQGCPEDCPGVCGCDGKFYCNACTANTNGVDISGDTSCIPGGACQSDAECSTGQKCCYPCGVPDCENQCMAPAPDGDCPLFP